jgi:hypothetical protein
LSTKIFPSSILSDENKLIVDTTEEGIAYMIQGNFLWEQTVSSTQWNITHNFNTNGVIVEFYDADWTKIKPAGFTLLDENTCRGYFNESITGYAVLKSIGFVNLKNDILADIFANGVIVELGNGTDKEYIKQSSITSLQNSIDEIIINTSDEIYSHGIDLCIDINFETDSEYDISEIGI